MKRHFFASFALVELTALVFVPWAFALNGYLDSGQHWNISPGGQIDYWIFQGGFPNIPIDSAITAIMGGFQMWINDLGSYVNFGYRGTTDRRSSLNINLTRDGFNVIDFQNMGAWDGAIAGTYRWPYPTGNPITENDVIFNTFYTFSVDQTPNTYDVANTATHEAGHFLRLRDTYDPDDSEQTMYGFEALGETKKVTLEWGDRAGVRYIYPNRYQAGSAGLGWWTAGADVAIGNVDGAGSTDMVMLWIDNPTPNNYVHYRFGWNLSSSNGNAASWSANKDMPGGIQDETTDAGVALVNLDGTSNLDMVVLWMDKQSPHNTVYYKIGWNLNTAGDPSFWSVTKIMPNAGVGATTNGVGVTFVNLDANSRPEMAVVWVDSPPSGNDVIYYKIGWNVNTTGDATSWSNADSKTGSIGSDPKGAGVAFANIDGDSTIDMVIFWVEDPSGANHGKYLVAYDVSSTGAVGSWSSVKTFPGDWQWVGDGTAGAGIAAADLNSNGKTEMIFLWVDDPYTENYAYYRVEWEGRVESHS